MEPTRELIEQWARECGLVDVFEDGGSWQSADAKSVSREDLTAFAEKASAWVQSSRLCITSVDRQMVYWTDNPDPSKPPEFD